MAPASLIPGIGATDDVTRFDFHLEGNLYLSPCHETWAELNVAYAHLERVENTICAVPLTVPVNDIWRGLDVSPTAVPGTCVISTTSFEANQLHLNLLVEDQWHDACTDWHVGGRVDYYHIDDDRTPDSDRDDVEFGLAFGVARHLSNFHTIYANASYGRRYPSLFELFATSVLDGVTVFPNPDLDLETSVNVEAGFKSSWVDETAQLATLQGAVFAHWVGEYIGRRDVPPDQVWDNLGDVWLYGAELTGAFRPCPCDCEGLEFFGSAATTLSSDESVVDEFPFHGRLGARFSRNCGPGCGLRRWFAEAAFRGAADSDHGDGTGGDAFVTADLLFGTGFQVGSRRTIQATAGVSNLFDESYTEPFARLPAAGLSFFAGLQLEF
jgi:outer membrane receptor protein involved in Fe transport